MAVIRCILKPFFLFLTLWLSVASAWAQSASPSLLDEGESTVYRLDPQALYLEDPTRELSLEQALAEEKAGNWKTASEKGLNFGFTASAFWTKLTLQKASDQHEWLMEFGYPLVDYVDVYTQDSSGNWQKQSYGDLLPFAERPFAYRNITLPLDLSPGQPRTVYIRMQTESSSQLPVIVQTKDTFLEKVINDQIRYGIQIGVVLVMILYNLFVFVVVRDKNYLLYVIAIFGNLSIVASVSGHVFQYVLPTMPLFANQYLLMSLNLSSAGNNLFALYFLNAKRYGKALHYLHWTYVVVGGLLIVSPFLTSYLVSAKFSVLLAFSSTYVLLGSSAWCWFKGNRTAAFFTLAWVFYLVGIQVVGLKNYGILPSGFLTDHAAEFGNALEVILLSFAVGDRYRLMRIEKEKAQEETLKAQAESLRVQKELNETLEDKVKARTQELSETLEELNHTNEELRVTLDQSVEQQMVIQQKNRNITDSIQYAKRIQQSILPSLQEFEAAFADSFVLFKPRDIVSGDFYFLHREKDRIFLAAVDCTGHGVPGALMSMLGNEILMEIITQGKVHSPEKVLEELNVRLRNALKQNETRIRDGMDIALVVFDPKEQKLEFAGAKSPLVYVKEGKMERLRGDRRAIGGEFHAKYKAFSKHVLPLEGIEAVYLFSDGYQDQFGGEKNRKFMLKRLLAKLEEGCQQPFSVQGQQLESELENWIQAARERQIDDVLVIGVKPPQ